MEHRWGDRIRSDVLVKLHADPASIGWGRVRDISSTGAFIETKLQLRPLSTLHVMRVREPARGGASAKIGAIVVRRDANGVGVEWFDGESELVCEMLREARAALAPTLRSADEPDSDTGRSRFAGGQQSY